MASKMNLRAVEKDILPLLEEYPSEALLIHSCLFSLIAQLSMMICYHTFVFVHG